MSKNLSTLKVMKMGIRSNSIDDLMLWVMILVGIKLFLRSDEVLDLKFHDAAGKNCVRWDLCQVRNDEVIALAFSIQGLP